MPLGELLGRAALVLACGLVLAWLSGCGGKAAAESHGEACEVGDQSGLVVEGEAPSADCLAMKARKDAPGRWCCL